MLVCDRCKGPIRPGQDVEFPGMEIPAREGNFIMTGDPIVVHAHPEECIPHGHYVLILFECNEDGSTGDLIQDPGVIQVMREFTGLATPTDSQGWGIWEMRLPVVNPVAQPNAMWADHHVISLRDQPWEEARHIMTRAIANGYLYWTMDDAVLLSKEKDDEHEWHEVDPDDPTRSLNWAHEGWWIDG